MTLPTLYKRTSTGKIQEWNIGATIAGDGRAVIVTQFGLTDGLKQVADEYILNGKNIGKANETTAYEQAELEAKSKWEGKKKKGYVENIDDARAGNVDKAVITGGYPVMLAHKFSEQGQKINYPCFVQPKLDGHRCIAVIDEGVCTLWSRTQKPILGVPHIQRQLESVYPHGLVVLDGELYNHDYKDKFEKLSSFIRQTTPKPGHEVVQYWVYDAILDNEPFSSRTLFLEESLSNRDSGALVVTNTFKIADESEILAATQGFIAQGFEGAMARNADSLYIPRRSYDLQKIKQFDDDEFEIVDVVPGKGKMDDKGVFICKTKAGDEFKAKMVGELDELKKYLVNKEDYIGKWLTVKYQGLTNKNGVPRFGVAMRIREEI